MEDGETAPCLEAFITLAEDPGLVSATNMVAHNHP